MCEWNWQLLFSFSLFVSVSLWFAHFLRPFFLLNRREIFAIYFRILNIAIKYYNLYLLIRTCTIHISVNFILWNASRKQNKRQKRRRQTSSRKELVIQVMNAIGILDCCQKKGRNELVQLFSCAREQLEIGLQDRASAKCFNFDFSHIIWFWDLCQNFVFIL